MGLEEEGRDTISLNFWGENVTDGLLVDCYLFGIVHI